MMIKESELNWTEILACILQSTNAHEAPALSWAWLRALVREQRERENAKEARSRLWAPRPSNSHQIGDLSHTGQVSLEVRRTKQSVLTFHSFFSKNTGFHILLGFPLFCFVNIVFLTNGTFVATPRQASLSVHFPTPFAPIVALRHILVIPTFPTSSLLSCLLCDVWWVIFDVTFKVSLRIFGIHGKRSYYQP